MKRVILTTGGTGGHIFPALAVAEELRERHPDVQLLFVGGRRGPEAKWAARAGLNFEALPVAGVLGRGWRALGIFGWLPRSLVRAMGIVRRFKPDVVLGLGGYAGFSLVLAAWILRVPTAIHEQNSLPGLTNRLLGGLVRKVMLSMPDSHDLFAVRKVVVTGNPLRKAVLRLRSVQPVGDTPRRNVLILGGSQGSKALNQAVLDSLAGFRDERVALWHQTGEADWERIVEEYARAGWEGTRVESFIEDVAEAYAWADLIVCRAGATTLAELTAMGKPSVLVPFPYATHNHQMLNARYLEQAGAALVLMESYLTQVQLWTVIKDLLDIPGKLRDMRRAAWELGRPEAGAMVVQELEGLVQQG